MKKVLFAFIFYVVLLCGTSFCVCAEEKIFSITVTNDWNKPKENEPVVLKIKDLNCGFDVKSVVVMDGSKEIASQIDELDGDRIADEVVFVADVAASSSKTYKMLLSNSLLGFPQSLNYIS